MPLNFAYVSDHAARALDRLIVQYRGKPLIEGIIRILGEQIQRVEDALNELVTERFLADAVGVQLDNLGAIIGEPRGNSVDDAEYRVRIQARLLTNRSRGTIDDIAGIFDVLLASPGYTDEYEPQYQAGFVWRILTPVTNGLGYFYATFLRDAKGAGIRGVLEWQEDDDTDMFVFFDGTGLGFDDGTGTVGGKFAAATLAGLNQGSV